MSGVNRVIILGRLGSDPEQRQAGETTICSLSLATSEKYKNKSGELVEETEWHRVSFFGNMAEVILKYSKKGDQLYIEGKLKTRSWEDNGVKKYMTEIIGSSFTFVGGKQEATPQANDVPEEDSLPF
jgi:single-strand DNA-binding protein